MGVCHEEEESEVGEYPLIKSAPCSTLVSLYIHNISLHTFHSPISKTLSFHPDGENCIFNKKKIQKNSFVAFSSKNEGKVREKNKHNAEQRI